MNMDITRRPRVKLLGINVFEIIRGSDNNAKTGHASRKYNCISRATLTLAVKTRVTTLHEFAAVKLRKQSNEVLQSQLR